MSTRPPHRARRAPRPAASRCRRNYRRSHPWSKLIQLAIVLVKLILLTIREIHRS